MDLIGTPLGFGLIIVNGTQRNSVGPRVELRSIRFYYKLLRNGIRFTVKALIILIRVGRGV